MKIGTVSLNINTHDLNYGAVLHSWAFQKLLQGYPGIETEVIDYTTPCFEKANLKYPVLNAIKAGKPKGVLAGLLRLRCHARRYNRFKEFVHANMTVSANHYTLRKLSMHPVAYDTVIFESDVIWSPGFFGGMFDPTFFGALQGMQHAKKIAYAPSIADGNFTPQQEERFIELAQGLDAVSCRETYAAPYLQKLLARPVACVLDPVFLLKARMYEEITAPRLIFEPYVLVYNPVEYNAGMMKAARAYAVKHNKSLVEISRFPWPKKLCKTITDAGIEEFLSLIKYSECIFSNSFHATAFAIVFQKDFYAFSRNSSGKVKDICQRVGLPERYVGSDFMEQPIVDYSRVQKKMSMEIANSISFLENALSLKKGG